MGSLTARGAAVAATGPTPYDQPEPRPGIMCPGSKNQITRIRLERPGRLRHQTWIAARPDQQDQSLPELARDCHLAGRQDHRLTRHTLRNSRTRRNFRGGLKRHTLRVQPQPEAGASPSYTIASPPSPDPARSPALRPPGDIWRARIAEYLTRLGESSSTWGKPTWMEAQGLIIM